MAYLLDANAFIEAKNFYYGFDFCPGYWDWLTEANSAGKLYSIERVGNELEAGSDELSDWARVQGRKFFLRPDASVFPSLSAVSQWASTGQYTPAAINTFLSVADYYLVSQAHAGGHIVVTREVPSASTRRIKIPDACIGLGIQHMTPFEMLRRERPRFILGAKVA